MRKDTRFLIALALVATACSAPSDPSDETPRDQDLTLARQEPAPPRDPNDPFFANHPQTGSFTLSNGQVKQTPWRAQSIDWWTVFATADAGQLEGLTKGTGYSNYLTTINGERRGVVSIHTLNYRDSDDGPYQAFLLTLHVYKDDGGPQKTFAWVNPYSSLVPDISGDLMFFFRGSVTGTHERTGRELLGFDKRQAKVLLKTTGDMSGDQSRDTVAFDEFNRPVAHAKWAINGKPEAQLAEADELAHALGLPGATALPPPKPESHQDGVGRDPMRPGHMKTHVGYAIWSPVMARWKPGQDKIDYAPESQFGRILRSLKIEPQVIMRDAHGKMSLDPDLGR